MTDQKKRQHQGPPAMATSDGGPAFPRTFVGDESAASYFNNGMTLRDYFAAKALSGLIAHPDGGGSFESLAEYAYKYAESMLKAREVKHV